MAVWHKQRDQLFTPLNSGSEGFALLNAGALFHLPLPPPELAVFFPSRRHRVTFTQIFWFHFKPFISWCQTTN